MFLWWKNEDGLIRYYGNLHGARKLRSLRSDMDFDILAIFPGSSKHPCVSGIHQSIDAPPQESPPSDGKSVLCCGIHHDHRNPSSNLINHAFASSISLTADPFSFQPSSLDMAPLQKEENLETQKMHLLKMVILASHLGGVCDSHVAWLGMHPAIFLVLANLHHRVATERWWRETVEWSQLRIFFFDSSSLWFEWWLVENEWLDILLG